MNVTIPATELEERSNALRTTFPAMPHGGKVLFDALRDAATIEDDKPVMLPAAKSARPE